MSLSKVENIFITTEGFRLNSLLSIRCCEINSQYAYQGRERFEKIGLGFLDLCTVFRIVLCFRRMQTIKIEALDVYFVIQTIGISYSISQLQFLVQCGFHAT